MVLKVMKIPFFFGALLKFAPGAQPPPHGMALHNRSRTAQYRAMINIMIRCLILYRY